MKGRGPIIAAALIAGLILLWWLTTPDSADAGDEPPPGPDDDLGDLTKLPNYRAAKDNRVQFSSHDDFVRTLDEAFLARFPAKGSRALLIAHAATAGWHTPGRPALYHWNLFGQLCTKEQIRQGVAFTLLKPNVPGAIYHPFRAFSSPYECLEGYLANVNAYDSGAVQYLDTRNPVLTRQECRRYAVLIKPWFARKERTPDALVLKGDKWFWIYNKFIKGKIL